MRREDSAAVVGKSVELVFARQEGLYVEPTKGLWGLYLVGIF